MYSTTTIVNNIQFVLGTMALIVIIIPIHDAKANGIFNIQPKYDPSKSYCNI